MIDYENLGRVNRPMFEEFRAAFEEVMVGGWYVLGEHVKRFEEAFAGYCGGGHCVGVGSGLDALTLALRALDLEPGAEVLVPSNTYIATIFSILHNGLKPVLVEPDLATYTIDPAKIEAAITLRTRAIMPVHLYGKMCDMDPITGLAEAYGLRIVEDCAQAHGARYKGRMAGTFGDFGAFSFYPTKNMGGLGDGGALTCRDEGLAESVRKLRNYGSGQKYYHEEVGYNSRLDDLQAALLLVKLRHLERINGHKRQLAKVYLENLEEEFIKPVVVPGFEDVYHIFTVRHPQRDKLREYLRGHGINTEIHYPVPPNKQKAMRGILDTITTPIAELIHETTLSLPISSFHSVAEVLEVVAVMNRFCRA